MYALKEDLITAKHYDKQFKIDAVQYYHDHKELGLIGCASNLGEYYGAAEPPVRCGESHLSGLTEPPQFVY